MTISIGTVIAVVVGCIVLQVTGSILGIWAYKKMMAGLWGSITTDNEN